MNEMTIKSEAIFGILPIGTPSTSIELGMKSV